MIIDNAHSLGLLDFARIRSGLSAYCLSREGADLVEASFPLTDSALVRGLKADAATLAAELRERELPSLSFPESLRARRVISKEGTVLEVQELYALGMWAKSCDRLLSWISGPGLRRALERSAPALQAPALQVGGPADPAGDGGEAFPDGWARMRLADILEGFPSLAGVQAAVFAILTNDGELRDLPGLRRIRDGITQAERDLRGIADSYFRDPELKSALQSGEPALRDGRTVLAVRANYRGRVKGIVHEVSATGQTVFIEPAALVEKNNELVQLEAALRAEILRILREATAALHGMRHSISLAAERLALLDGMLARALQSVRTGAVPARDLDSGFSLIKGRHPLLGKKAVPIDVDLPPGARTLIVTGPNTGGKTVTLKTIGLFALMNQFGMSLPAASETGFSVFDGVWADIGDEQSIDQSLSTFSGHMRVLGGISAAATARSLVLLDELGAGTDPEEGCAVAMGLLDHFIGRGALTVVTTHHGILKNYGYTREGCLNASMDFDAKSLSPTYRIVMGVPGESRALDIASQNGLSAEIVETARRYLREERTDVSELIKGLSEKHRELESLETERQHRLREARQDQRKADLAALRVRRQEVELRRKGVSEVQRLLAESRKTLENLVRELRESGADSLRTREVKGFLAQLAEGVERQRELLESTEDALATAESGLAGSGGAENIPEGVGPAAASASLPAGTGRARKRRAAAADASGPALAKPAGAPAAADIQQGDAVLVGPSRRPGTVMRAAAGGKWLVEVGSMKLTVALRELVRVPGAAQARPSVEPAGVPSYHVELAPRDGETSVRALFELDVRGMRLAEALVAVERQVDAAALQGLSLFSIIHGTGEGILGPGIHEYLKASPAVAEYHFSRPEEGGYGKTSVRLK